MPIDAIIKTDGDAAISMVGRDGDEIAWMWTHCGDEFMVDSLVEVVDDHAALSH